MASVAVDEMLAQGLAEAVGADGVERFLRGDGLRVLLFSGLGGGRSEGHDVAVALRELLKEHAGGVRAGIVDGEAERALMARFRVAVLPSLVLVVGGETMEVLPRVRDWNDYAQAFRRYLGAAGAPAQETRQSGNEALP